MKSLPKGTYALCISHPGHELRLYGFMEQASPFVFLLTDGSHRTGKDMMFDSIRCIDKATKYGKKVTAGYLATPESKKIFKLSDHEKPEGENHLKDLDIYHEILNHYEGIFRMYINFLKINFIKYKVDHVVSDPREETNLCHEIMNIMVQVAIQEVKNQTGKIITHYDFAIDMPFNFNIDEGCIHVQLDEYAVERKLDAVLKYPLGIMDMKPNISMDYNLLLEFNKMPNGASTIKAMAKDINFDYLKNEYLRPFVFTESVDKPLYQTHGEKAVADGKYHDVITYQNHLKPLQEKLMKPLSSNDIN